jgi:hypothetical protein
VVIVREGGTRWRSWFRYYVTSRKVGVRLPMKSFDFFNWPNPSSCTMALRSTQPLTIMSTRNFPGRKGQPTCKADKFTTLSEPIFLENLGASTSHNPMGLHGLLQGQLYLWWKMQLYMWGRKMFLLWKFGGVSTCSACISITFLLLDQIWHDGGGPPWGSSSSLKTAEDLF